MLAILNSSIKQVVTQMMEWGDKDLAATNTGNQFFKRTSTAPDEDSFDTSSSDKDKKSTTNKNNSTHVFHHDNMRTVPGDDDSWYPNNPHPLLEYPPLYFVFKYFPKLMACIQSLYKIRWELSYPLQRRVPLSKLLRKIGISLTWGELLLWTPFVLILIQGMLSTFVTPSVSQSGLVARLPLAICFLTASHNSILTLLLGIPFERALKYHKVSGYCAFINGIFHTYIAFVAADKDNQVEGHNTSDFFRFLDFSTDGQVNTSGTCLMVIILSMITTSLPVVRRVVFEVFYYFHILFAMTMVVCAFYHSGIFVVIVASVLWGGDFVFRRIIMACRYPHTATVGRLTDTVVEISIKKTKNFDYNGGQYMFVAIPEVSIFQWHPISISSSPFENVVTFHIRKRGNWTSALFELAGKKKEVTVFLEGPYGSLSIDLTSNRYKMVMFLAGGIGVTPMQSICQQMLYEHEEWNERELKKIWFIFTARDPQVIENMDISRHRDQSYNISDKNLGLGLEGGGVQVDVGSIFNSSSSMSERSLLTEMPMARTPDKELERELPLDEFLIEEEEEEEEEEKGNDVELVVENDEEKHQRRNSTCNKSSVIHALHKIAESDSASFPNNRVLSLDCYLTAKEMKEAGITSMLFARQGRPDMKKQFLMMREEAIKCGEKRVAVCVCAPKRLVQICKLACIKYSNSKVQFDFHTEVFD